MLLSKVPNPNYMHGTIATQKGMGGVMMLDQNMLDQDMRGVMMLDQRPAG